MRAVVAVLLFVAAVHAGMWGLLRDRQQAPDFKGILPSVSYAPFEGSGHPDVDNIPNTARIRTDMQALAPLTRAIREIAVLVIAGTPKNGTRALFLPTGARWSDAYQTT